MKRILITIAYDGTDYSGFQRQPGKKTVEGELCRALTELTGEDISILGASRTDAGVHAEGNAAVFDTASSIPPERYPYALRKYLPPDIRVTGGTGVPADWHPRKRDSVKTYEYSIYSGPIENPLLRRYSAYSRYDLDEERMNRAASYLTGEHDFTSFANPSSQVLLGGGSAIRTIYSIKIEKKYFYCTDLGFAVNNPGFMPSIITVTVSGSGFLYNMVRIIAGTLISVGSGLKEPAWVHDALLAKDRTRSGPTAPACGLTLKHIEWV